MSTFFVKTLVIAGGTAPNDANDGLDPIGFNLSGATYDDTGNGEGERHLSSVGAFTNYVFTSGDRIFLDAGAGVTPGLFEIAARVDDDAILLVASAGSDSTADVGSSTGPFLNPQIAIDTVAPGDLVLICDDATHPLAEIMLWTSANSTPGLITAPIVFRGADARGVDSFVGTSSVTVIDANGLASVISDNAEANEMDFITFQNLHVQNATSNGVFIDADQTGLKFVDFKSSDHTGSGIRITTNPVITMSLVRCELFDNGGFGLGQPFAALYVSVVDCSFHDNGGDGIQAGTLDMHNTLCYDNGGHGISFTTINPFRHLTLVNCVSHGNGMDGLRNESAAGTHSFIIRNCVFARNTGFGINLAGIDTHVVVIGPNNYFNNTAGRASIDGAVEVSIAAIEVNNNTVGVETDPNFASIVDGSEDFTPAAQDPIFSQGEAGDVPDGVSTVRPTYMGVVAPNLLVGGDGGGSTADPVFLVLANRQDHTARVEGVDGIAVSAVDGATAIAMAKSLFSGDGNTSWDNALAVQIDAAADFQGWRLRARISPPGGGVIVDETFTGLAAATMDDLGSGLAALLNTTPSIANSSYDTGSNVLTVADVADNLGDHAIEVDLLPPAANTGPVNIPGGVLSVTDEGVAAAALEAQMGDDDFAIPGVAVPFQQR